MIRPYRVLVTGSRDWGDQDAIVGALRQIRRDIEGRPIVVVHGDCPTGADAIASYLVKRAAPTFGLTEEPHRAEDFGPWPRCGPIRNRHMVTLGADICLAFIKDGSRGATHCAELAERAGIPVKRWTA